MLTLELVSSDSKRVDASAMIREAEDDF